MKSVFPIKLKLAEVLPVFKKGSSTDKENYRPISILSNISKIYERIVFDQVSKYFKDLFSKHQCGFRKGYSAQHCLLAMLEKWKICADNGGVFGAILTDLSKAFDCLPHDLIIAKLNADKFELTSLKFMHNYLYNRKQRVKVKKSFSIWEECKSWCTTRLHPWATAF